MPYADPEKRRQYQRDGQEKNRLKMRAYSRKSYYKRHEAELERSRKRNAESKQYIRDWHQANKARRMKRVIERYQSDDAVRAMRNQHMKASNAKVRNEVFDHYGRRCACCGESELAFLSIDHEAGGGNQHRKSIGIKAGVHFYRWLRKQGFPTGYRVLCHNCNMATSFYG